MMCNDFDMFCRRNFDVEESTAGVGSGEGRARIEEHLARGERVHTLSAFIVALVYAYTAMLSDSFDSPRSSPFCFCFGLFMKT